MGRLSRGATQGAGQRAARFPPRWRRAVRGGKARFAAIQEELSALSAKFSEHVLDATDAFALYVEDARLSGIPAEVLAAAKPRRRRRKARLEAHLQMPCYLPVMAHADDRALREQLPCVFRARSELGSKPELDNTPVIKRILVLRAELAALLGCRLRRVFAGHQDGRKPGAGAGFPARPGRARCRSRAATAPSRKPSPAKTSGWKR
jgi:hypothetical protein